MIKPRKICVVASAASYIHIENLVASVRLAQPSSIELLVRVPLDLLKECGYFEDKYPGVSFTSEFDDLPNLLPEVEYILSIPRCNPALITGISGAADLLDANSDLVEVGGLMFGSDGSISSSALSIIDESPLGDISLAPLETTRPIWLTFGPHAFANADLLGGLSLVRKEHFGPRHLSGASGFARAMSRLEGNWQGSSAVLSSFTLRCLGTSDLETVGNSSVELVPFTNPSLLQKNGTSGVITVLHSGFAVFHEELAKFLYFPKPLVESVDGEKIGDPFSIRVYYRHSLTQRQLGPSANLVFSNYAQVWPDAEFSYQHHLTAAESDLLAAAKRLSRLVPTKLLRLLEGILSKYIRRS